MSRHAPRSLLLSLVAAVGLLAVACSGDADDAATPTATIVAEPAATSVAGEPPPPVETAPAASATPPLPPAEAIDWRECPSGPFDCAEYEVPMDYDDPDGDTVTLALRRLPAEEPDERIGLLFANPGGPGGSTINILSQWARNLPSEIRERFDIILFDPRGVGHSSPLVCHDNIQELIGLDPYPQTQEDWDVIIEATREFAEGCEAAGGALLAHMGTKDVARDMDRIREAEGEENLTYFGYSYGTTIGQVYADMFPHRVRAMVLDGALDLSLAFDAVNLEQILGFEAAFERYVAACRSNGCVPGDPKETIRSLIERASVEPIPASEGDRPVGAGEILQAILASLYSQSSWFLLTSGVNSALAGDGSVILLLADSLADRRRDGEYGNLVEANVAVNCRDNETNRDLNYYREIAGGFEAEAPIFGPLAAQFGLYCALWAAEPDPLLTPRASGAPPIMVIGNTGDPATPYKWAAALAEQLQSGFLVTNDVEGHGAYRLTSDCIDDAVDAYLLHLTLPPQSLTCGNAGIGPVPPVP